MQPDPSARMNQAIRDAAWLAQNRIHADGVSLNDVLVDDELGSR